MKIRGLIFGLFSLILQEVQAQQSVNVIGNYDESYRVSGIEKISDGFVAFGTSKTLSVQHFSFEKGNDWSLNIRQKNGNSFQTINGTGGVMENDSTMVLLGRQGTENILILKITLSGKIFWANWYSTGLDEHPDKIVRLQNGDYLVSVRTNVSYYEFGEWGSRSAVMRIDPSGKLKWCRVLDYRTANTGSVVLGMFETPGNNLIIAQSYNTNLGLFKLSANGDSLHSLLSNQTFVGAAADCKPSMNRLFIVSPDKKVLCLDTNFNVIWQKEISSTSLNSTADIRIMNDSMLAIGGKYQNHGCILFTNMQAIVQQGLFKTYYPPNQSNLRHLAMIDDTLYSILSSGWAVTSHPLGGPTCFNTANGSVFTTTNLSALTFKPHVKISGSATYDAVTDLIAQKVDVAYPVRNCLKFDLSAQTEKKDLYETCQYANPRIWVTNQGTTNISSLKVKYTLNGIWFDSSYTITTLGSKGSAYVYLGNHKFHDSVNVFKGYVYAPNGEQDEFMLNDSFITTYHTRAFKVLKITGKDTICEGVTNRLEVRKYPGLYDWYRDGKLILKEAFFNYNSAVPGDYYCILNDSFCNIYSDTFRVTALPAPKIRKSGDTLYTDISEKVYWFRNSVIIDSFKSYIIPKIPGKFWSWYSNRVHGCDLMSNQIDISFSSSPEILTSALRILNNRIFRWEGNNPVDIGIYSVDGRIILERKQWSGEWMPKIQSGIYLIQISDRHEVIWQKVWLE